MKLSKKAILLPSIVIIVLAVMAKVGSTPRIIDESKSITVDDFLFSASDLRTARAIGGVQAPQGDAFYVLEARVTNKALRVDFKFLPQIFRLYTDGGIALENSPAGQAALDTTLGSPQMDPVSIKPQGDSAERAVVFQGPQGLTRARAAIETGGWIGNVLDDLFFENVNFEMHVHGQ